MSNGECRPRSDCTFVQADFNLHPPQNKSMVGNGRIKLNSLKHFPRRAWFLRVCYSSLLKTLWEKEKLLVTSNFSFSPVFSIRLEIFTPFSSSLKLSSANTLSLKESELSGLGRVNIRQNLRLVQFESMYGQQIKYAPDTELVHGRVENSAEKGGNAGRQQYLLFPQYFVELSCLNWRFCA